MARLLVALAALALIFATPANADVPGIVDPPGCTTDTIFGLNPHYRSICDSPLQPNGSWTRTRQLWSKQYVGSLCGDYGYMTRTGYVCPDWAPRDITPAAQGPVETYVVTPDTIPPGEPGYLG